MLQVTSIIFHLGDDLQHTLVLSHSFVNSEISRLSSLTAVSFFVWVVRLSFAIPTIL